MILGTLTQPKTFFPPKEYPPIYFPPVKVFSVIQFLILSFKTKGRFQLLPNLYI